MPSPDYLQREKLGHAHGEQQLTPAGLRNEKMLGMGIDLFRELPVTETISASSCSCNHMYPHSLFTHVGPQDLGCCFLTQEGFVLPSWEQATPCNFTARYRVKLRRLDEDMK